MKTLSVVIPVYNESKTILKLLERVEAAKIGDIKKEIILIDDCSKDGTRDMLRGLSQEKYKVMYHERNLGKGAAVRTGFENATGDFIIIQDADLEYDPNEYAAVLAPLIDGRADAVYGSRFIGDRPHRVLFFWHSLGNKMLTLFSNMLADMNLTDMETCYKAFTSNALLQFRDELKSNRFGIDPEITARIAKHKLRVYEVGISYSGRTYAEGKKIGWKDGFSAIWAIIRFNFFS